MSSKNKVVEKNTPKLFTKWKNGIEENNPNLLSSLYSEDTTFLPTLLDKFVEKEEDIKNYFISLLKNKIKINLIKQDIKHLGEIILHSGFYDFICLDENKEETIINARFTFVYKKINEKWKILHHHSSQMPKATI